MRLQPFQGGDLRFQFGDRARRRGVVDERLIGHLDLRFRGIVEVFRIVEAVAIEYRICAQTPAALQDALGVEALAR